MIVLMTAGIKKQSFEPYLLTVYLRIIHCLHALIHIRACDRIPRQYNFMLAAIILVCVTHITWQRTLSGAKVWTRRWSVVGVGTTQGKTTLLVAALCDKTNKT